MNTLPPVRPACGLCCTILENFGVKYQDHVALDDICMHIHCGEMTAIIGPNGAGKSSLFKALLGEVPHSGRLFFLDAENKRAGKPVIGYVPQKMDFDPTMPLSVEDFFSSTRSRWPVLLGTSAGQRARSISMLARVDASHLLHRKLGELSGGELQRVLLALALEPVPDLLLLDEPGTGVDIQGMKVFYEMLDEFRHAYDLSILVISHEMELVAQYADRVVLLNQNILASGKPRDVFAHPQFATQFGLIPALDPPDYRIREEEPI